MGDRYTITAKAETIEERFHVDPTERYAPRFNAAPTQLLPVITQGSKGFSFFYWGQIPGRSKNRSISTKLILAEKELLTEKASNFQALKHRRCIIPSDGYYDWKQISRKGKVPYRIIFEKGSLISFAGIWEEFEDDEENVVHTFKIITTPANKVIAGLNSRMPAILTADQEVSWLDPTTPTEALIELLQPYPSEKTSSYTVSPGIGDLNNDGPSLIQHMAPADQFGNYSLFD